MGLVLIIVRETEDEISFENDDDDIWQSSYFGWSKFLDEIDMFIRMKELEKDGAEQLKETKRNIDDLIIALGKYPEIKSIIHPKLEDEKTRYHSLSKIDTDVFGLFCTDDEDHKYWSTEKCRNILDFLRTLPADAPIDRRWQWLRNGLETCVKEGYRVLHC